MAGLDLSQAISWLSESMETIPQLAEAIRQSRLEEAASHIRDIAEGEAKAYAELSRIVGVTEPATPG